MQTAQIVSFESDIDRLCRWGGTEDHDLDSVFPRGLAEMLQGRGEQVKAFALIFSSSEGAKKH